MAKTMHDNKENKEFPKYRSLRCGQMTEEDIRATVELFGKNYGVWAKNDNPKYIPGKNITMPFEFMKKSIVDKPDRYIAMAYVDDLLVGYAYYMRRKTPSGKMVTWILQLVVDDKYRGRSIGTKIMHSIWGMSDSWAWGLYTANPFTIKCLQDATMRKVRKNLVKQHLEELKSVAKDLLPTDNWIDTYTDGAVNTSFPIDFLKTVEDFRARFPNEKFDLNDDLKVGYEWLAFVFSDQNPKPSDQQVQKYFAFSEDITKDAYSKMEMERHEWASHTDKEVDFIINIANNPRTILDLGCGHGRHSIKLAEQGIKTTGIDYVEMPPEVKIQESDRLHFECADARNVRLGKLFDTVLALYDVVGSFTEESDNLKILDTAYRHLKNKGMLIMSVMNMHLTWNECKKHNNLVHGVRKNINAIKLISLKGSRSMQKTGQVFDGRNIIIDTTTGICFRKEQFFCENNLPIEYVVVDRRYTMEGIKKLVEAAGFIVEKCYCAQAGKFEKELKPEDYRAKEILIVARKGSLFRKVFEVRDIDKCWV